MRVGRRVVKRVRMRLSRKVRRRLRSIRKERVSEFGTTGGLWLCDQGTLQSDSSQSHCTLYNVRCFLYINGTMYNVHCTIYTVHCTQ